MFLILSFCSAQNYIVSSERCGELHVHVQGEISQQEKRACFLTVHDLGTNREWHVT